MPVVHVCGERASTLFEDVPGYDDFDHLLKVVNEYMAGWLPVQLLWVPCLHIAGRRAVGRRDQPPPARDYLAAVTALTALPALWNAAGVCVVIYALVDGADSKMAKEEMLSHDPVEVRANASTWLSLSLIQLGLLFEAMRRTNYLRRRVGLHRKLHAARLGAAAAAAAAAGAGAGALGDAPLFLSEDFDGQKSALARTDGDEEADDRLPPV